MFTGYKSEQRTPTRSLNNSKSILYGVTILTRRDYTLRLSKNVAQSGAQNLTLLRAASDTANAFVKSIP